ncbi:(2Fe-2S)-binding protein [Streptomyces sp. NPDC090306]|uniref:(2Fe-2S)-binding protein n=1 Tax=unclassified Streptomyces TaxID=2593676 RepID=UPI0036EFE293
MPVLSSATADAYARLTEVYPYLAVTELGHGERPADHADTRWLAVGALAEGGAALDSFLAWDERQTVEEYGRRARPDVVATFGLHRYAFPATLLVTLPWFLHRRVPRYPVGNVWYAREAGRFAVLPGDFACLPGDPAALLPGARVVPDEEALRTEVRAAVAEHLEPLLAAFGPRMRRRGRALWGMATDEIVDGLWYLGELLGEEERAVRELELLLPGATLPYIGTAGFRELSGPDGQSLQTRDRASCCMYYTLRPDDTCGTCPRTCDADRVAKITAAAA